MSNADCQHLIQSRPAGQRRARDPKPLTPGLASINRIIDEGTISTAFQPIVNLETQNVVGFEALSRGPEGTALETPMALIDAARSVGRLGELDWLCRVRAMQAATSSGLPGSLSWFINVEPAGLEIPCPARLLPALAEARSNLRIVLEIVERDVDGHVTQLLHAADQARADAWGVALDDVGAKESSLALLPFLQPDVVKLDMSLVRQLPDPAAAAVTAAVRSYAEHTGASILAEGIETAEQETLARAYGATYGQGFRYGAPGPLPAHVPAPRAAIPLRQKPSPLGDATPFEIVSAAVQPERAEKKVLMHITQHLEAQASDLRESMVLLAGFQDQRFFTDRKRRRYEELAQANAMTVVLASGVREQHKDKLRVAHPLPDSRMGQEWVVIVLSPLRAAAFIARDCGDANPDGQRRFDFVFTHDRALVIRAARSFMGQLDRGAGGILAPAVPAARPMSDSVAAAQRRAALLGRFHLLGPERHDTPLVSPSVS